MADAESINPDAPSLVLVVDDDRDTGEMLITLLEDKGYAVEWCATATDAIARLRVPHASKRPPDLVLLDLMLPDMDGVEVVRQLNTEGDLTPSFIVLSAKPAAAVASAARAIGAAAGVRKPFDVAKLLQAVKVAIDRRSGSSAAPSAALLSMMNAFDFESPSLTAMLADCDDESTHWLSARQIVEGTLFELGVKRLRALSDDLELAYRCFEAATRVQAIMSTVRITGGGAELDFAATDSLSFSLLQLAVTIAKHFTKPTASRASTVAPA
ncbi:MAG: hypothetical protein NVSMB1_10160 [Polyangiales bacterium]